MLIFAIAICASMLLMSLFLLSGRGAFLISGYNMMSKEERANYNEKKLCRDVGKLVLSITLSMAVMFIGINFEIYWLITTGTILIAALSFGAVFFFNSSKRYLKEGADVKNVRFLRRGRFTKFHVVILVLTFIGVGTLMLLGFNEPNVTVSESNVRISGIYGLTVDFVEISSVTLIEQSMREIGAGSRTNGFSGVGDVLKGNFRSHTHGETLLFIRATSSPTIHIERPDARDIFISFADSDETLSLYYELIRAFN